MWDLIVSVPDHCLSFYFNHPVVYATDRSKAVVPVLFLFCVALWFILRDASCLRCVMSIPVYAICEQQRRRSACASTQSDQRLCCSLPG